jgi:predicted neuraminidase
MKHALGAACMAGLMSGGFALAAEAPVAVQSAADFQAKVEQAGGRVDFLFEDERPFKECHASCVVAAADGSLVATWFGGEHEKNPDVAIWNARYVDGAWTPVEQVAKVNETAHWNPVVFTDAEGMLYEFFKIGPEIKAWQTYWMRSSDHGKSWSAPVELVAGDFGGRGPVRSKPIILSDGTWLAPSSSELEKQPWEAFVDRSTDRGQTWERTANFAQDGSTAMKGGAIQPTLWESTPGHVHALLRSKMGRILRSDSHDNGKTWSAMRPIDLPNNNSGIDVVKLDAERLLLAYNPVGKNWGGRSPLTLALSTDNGETWTAIANVEEEPEMEFSYPSLAKTKDGVAFTYTWKRERIRCWQIPMAVLAR